MTFFRHRVEIVLLGILWTFFHVLGAEQPPASPPGGPPLPPSPIQQFREWLSMPEPEREKAVAEWPQEKRTILLRKLKTYEALSMEEREGRLRVLELRWYLRPLLAMSSGEREAALPLVPNYLKAIVAERLRHWDSLQPEARAEILANDDARELVTRYYLQVQQGRSKEQILFALSPEKRAELDQALKVLNSMTAASRNRTTAQLREFFQMPPGEQTRTVRGLSEAERLDVERTLAAFAELSPEQRRICIDSFEKFTMMPPPERASFLRNAARWEAMSPEERTTWKNLVTKLPPLPPGPTLLPPRPGAAQSQNPANRKVAQTNAGELR